jgi:hypothetical protein
MNTKDQKPTLTSVCELKDPSRDGREMEYTILSPFNQSNLSPSPEIKVQML